VICTRNLDSTTLIQRRQAAHVVTHTKARRDGVRQSFDVSADGKRVVIFPRPAADQAEGPLHATFLLNFFDEGRRRIP